MIFDSLITSDENYNLEYVLASEIAKIDSLTYVIKLRDDVYWHDGTLFSAKDVIFTINKIANSEGFVSPYKTNLKNVESVQEIDSNTIQIKLSQEVDFFEYKLTFPIFKL